MGFNSGFKGLKPHCFYWLFALWRWDPIDCPETSVKNHHSVLRNTSEDLIYTASEAWIHALVGIFFYTPLALRALLNFLPKSHIPMSAWVLEEMQIAFSLPCVYFHCVMKGRAWHYSHLFVNSMHGRMFPLRCVLRFAHICEHRSKIRPLISMYPSACWVASEYFACVRCSHQL